MLRKTSLSRGCCWPRWRSSRWRWSSPPSPIGFVLHRFVQGQIDQRLDTQIVFLSSMLRADGDGTIVADRQRRRPPFERARRGWYWQVTGPGTRCARGRWTGADLDTAAGSPRLRPPPTAGQDEAEDGAQGRSPKTGRWPRTGRRAACIIASSRTTVSGMPATIVASAPRAAVLGTAARSDDDARDFACRARDRAGAGHHAAGPARAAAAGAAAPIGRRRPGRTKRARAGAPAARDPAAGAPSSTACWTRMPPISNARGAMSPIWRTD